MAFCRCIRHCLVFTTGRSTFFIIFFFMKPDSQVVDTRYRRVVHQVYVEYYVVNCVALTHEMIVYCVCPADFAPKGKEAFHMKTVQHYFEVQRCKTCLLAPSRKKYRMDVQIGRLPFLLCRYFVTSHVPRGGAYIYTFFLTVLAPLPLLRSVCLFTCLCLLAHLGQKCTL